MKALKYYLTELKKDDELIEETMLDYLNMEYRGENNKSLKLKLERK